jgi:hypothetical protein
MGTPGKARLRIGDATRDRDGLVIADTPSQPGIPDPQSGQKKFNSRLVVPTLNHRWSTRIASDGRFSFNNRGLRADGWGPKGLAHSRSIGPELPQLVSQSAHTEFKSRSHCPQVDCANHLLAIALCKSHFGKGFFPAAFVNGCYGLHKLNAASVCRTCVAPTRACRSGALALLQWF